MPQLAIAIYMEALFTECCRHDCLCFGDWQFNVDDYFAARRAFAERNRA